MALSVAQLTQELRLGKVSVRDAAYRTWVRSNRHDLMTRAAAITFYAIAAMVPFLALVIALSAKWLPWILRHLGMTDATEIDPLEPLRGLLPVGAFTLVLDELKELREHPPVGLLSFSLAATLWMSSSVYMGVIDAMNVVRGVRESRPYWKRRLMAMIMTLAQAAILIGSVATIVGWPLFVRLLGLSSPAATIATACHAVLVFLLVLFSFTLMLFVGPDVRLRWKCVAPGGLAGTIVVLVVSFLFRFYAQRWGNYSATYGSLAGIILLMTWVWLCAVTLLYAAELNKVIEDALPVCNTR
jgi:membrane protein